MSDIIEDPATPDEPSRRDLLGKSAVAAAVAAVAGVAMAKSASAVNGDPILVGGAFTGTTSTALSGGTTLMVTNGTSSGNASIHGRQTSGTGGVGVLGEANAVTDSVGVLGRSGVSGSTGVWGDSQGSSWGTGVFGSSTAGVGVVGEGGTADFMTAGNGFIWISVAGVSNPPGDGSVGSIARDSSGNLWYAHATDQWRRLAGPTAAGAYHAISPVRVYDSRAAAPEPGVLASNLSRVVSVKDGRNSAGIVTAANVVPAGATAVTFNVTATGTTGPNFLAVVPGDAVSFSTSTLNWSGGSDIANASTVKLDASRQVKVFMGDNVGSSHFIIDITGFYL